MEQFGTYFQGMYSHLPTNLKKQFPLVSSNISLDRKDRDDVVWIGFDTLEYGNVKIQCIVVAYTSGFQIWNIQDLENIQEILSVRDEVANMVKILPPPTKDENDQFMENRPLIAVGCGFTVQLLTIKSKRVNLLKFKTEVLGFKANSKILIVSQREKIHGFSSHNMIRLFSLDTFPIPESFNRDVMALGSRWLAYPTNKPSNDNCQTSSSDNIISTANQWASHLIKLGSENLTEYKRKPQSPTMKASGTVMIYDIVNHSTVAHWFVHSQPLTFLAFDPSGALLVTSSSEGHHFNVFKITPRPKYNTEENRSPTFQHLYKLQRGITNTIIGDISFSNDSLWISVSSIHGTTHIYPIHPEGGPVSAKTHLGEKDSITNMLPRKVSCQTFGPSERIRQIVVKSENDTLSKVPHITKPNAISSIVHFPKQMINSKLEKNFSRKLLILNQLGILTEYILVPHESQETLIVHSTILKEWDLCRKKEWITIRRGIDDILFERKHDDVKAITNVEIITNEPNKVPLCLSPQFSFYAYQKSEPDGENMVQNYKKIPFKKVSPIRRKTSRSLTDKSEIPFPDLSPTQTNENLYGKNIVYF